VSQMYKHPYSITSRRIVKLPILKVRTIAFGWTPHESVILSDRRGPAPQGAKNLAFSQHREILRRFAPQNDSNTLALDPNAIALPTSSQGNRIQH
jgi:hypothetical protein